MYSKSEKKGCMTDSYHTYSFFTYYYNAIIPIGYIMYKPIFYNENPDAVSTVSGAHDGLTGRSVEEHSAFHPHTHTHTHRGKN